MREMFEDAAAKAPLDPQEAARSAAAAPKMKRFYQAVSVEERDGGFAVMLDGRALRTPAKRVLLPPNRGLAERIAAEWAAQGEFIQPMTMPLTRLANSVDSIQDRQEAVRDDAAKYFRSDLLFYRASHPEQLVAREAQHWDPVLFWAAETLGAHFILAQGVMHVSQPEAAVAAARAAMPDDVWSLAAFHVLTTLTGSALLPLALLRGFRSADQVWAAAHVDEDWNVEQWGADEEAMARRAARHAEFGASVAMLSAMQGG